MRIHQALFIGFALVLSNHALAQTTEGTEENSEKCQAQPQDQEEGATATTRSLTETLDDCNGVLIPPPTGDEELTEPAPNEGETPVIRPGEIPEQPNSE